MPGTLPLSCTDWGADFPRAVVSCIWSELSLQPKFRKISFFKGPLKSYLRTYTNKNSQYISSRGLVYVFLFLVGLFSFVFFGTSFENIFKETN